MARSVRNQKAMCESITFIFMSRDVSREASRDTNNSVRKAFFTFPVLICRSAL